MPVQEKNAKMNRYAWFFAVLPSSTLRVLLYDMMEAQRHRWLKKMVLHNILCNNMCNIHCYNIKCITVFFWTFIGAVLSLCAEMSECNMETIRSSDAFKNNQGKMSQQNWASLSLFEKNLMANVTRKQKLFKFKKYNQNLEKYNLNLDKSSVKLEKYDLNMEKYDLNLKFSFY